MKRPLVLMSDDDPLVVAAFTMCASRKGIAVVPDLTAEGLVSLASGVKPDLVVLDVRHKVDGRVLLAGLKRDPATRDLKVLMLSGVEDQVTRTMCLALGAVDYAVKPLDVGVMNKVARLVGLDPSKSRPPGPDLPWNRNTAEPQEKGAPKRPPPPPSDALS